MWPKHNSDLKKFLTKITSISKLRIILLTNKYIYLFLLKNAKCTAGERDRKHFKTGLYTDTGYPMQTPNLYLTLIFFHKKGYFFL